MLSATLRCLLRTMKFLNHPSKWLPKKAFVMPTFTFEDTDMYSDDPYYNRLLFITGDINDKAISKIMVDGGSTINILSMKTLSWIRIKAS